MKFAAAQVVGLVAMLFFILSFQSNNKKRILTFQGISAGVFTLHFVLLGAYTGAGMNAIEIGRNLILLKFENSRWKPVWVTIFFLLFIAIGIITWQNTWGLLPIFGQCLATLTLSFKKPRYIRFLFVPVSLLWLVYNIVSLSIAGILTESINLLSLAVAIWRFEKRGKTSESTPGQDERYSGCRNDV